MIDLKGHTLTLNNKKYVVVGNKEIDNLDLVIVYAADPPVGIKLMEVREEDDGEILARLYDGMDDKTIIEKYGDEILESIQGIREIIRTRPPEG